MRPTLVKEGQKGVECFECVLLNWANVVFIEKRYVLIRSYFCFFPIQSSSSSHWFLAYWIRDLSFCPRKREAIRQRQCFKSCFDDSDCRSRYRSCVCDFDCGMSCIKRGQSMFILTSRESFSLNRLFSFRYHLSISHRSWTWNYHVFRWK